MRHTVAYIMPLPPGLHPGMDTIAHGIAAALDGSNVGLRVLPIDLRDPDSGTAQCEAVLAAANSNVAAICLFTLDETQPAAAVRLARRKGVPVVAIHKTRFPVSATVAVPNYYHGLYLQQFLAQHLGPAPRVAIVGGPAIVDDEELVDGLIEGARRCGFRLVNDPHEAACRNLADVAGGGVAAARHVLDAHPDLDALVVFNDETLLDVLPELERRGLRGTLPVVSRNGSPAAVEAVRRGDSLATYDYGLPEIGIAAGKLLRDILSDGRDPRGEVICPTFGWLIDREAAERYVPWSERAAEVELVVGL